MFCHQCNTQNIATDMRCIQCGASLLGDSISTPEEFAKKFQDQDARVYGRVWAALFVLGYFVLTLIAIPEIVDSRVLLLGGAALAAAIGHFVGKAVAKQHNGGF
jgi:hypothetical protein